MRFLIDTNILLRSVQPSHPIHLLAVRAVETLLSRGEPLAVAVQNMAEFWNAATRPVVHNGLGFTIEEAQQELARLERYFQVLSENAASYTTWKTLVINNRINGVQVHDARLVAVMKTYVIPQILTFNVADFARFSDVEAVHPEKIA